MNNISKNQDDQFQTRAMRRVLQNHVFRRDFKEESTPLKRNETATFH